MIYSIHTMELRLVLNRDEFDELLSNSFKKAKGSHKLGKSSLYKDRDVYVDNALIRKGIKIEFHNDRYRKKIKFIVNPSKILGGDDLKLWKPKEKNITELNCLLDSYISEYFDFEYDLNDFILYRVDFTVNIDVQKEENVPAYIKVFYNIGKVKGFSPKYDKYDEHIDKDLSFDLTGNSNNTEFSIYNKYAESNRIDAKGILRVEVRLKKHKAISRYTDETKTSKQIRDLAKNSRDIFLDTFRRIVPFGDYYKKKTAVSIILECDLSARRKNKMLKLLELIPQKKSLYLAIKEMNDRNIDKIIEDFAKLDLSPVTLSKRHSVTSLKSLYKYL